MNIFFAKAYKPLNYSGFDSNCVCINLGNVALNLSKFSIPKIYISTQSLLQIGTTDKEINYRKLK